jgi:preprotein translocase subunit YajC
MDLSLLFPLLILLLLVPMFLTSRRQRRQVQEMQQMQSSLERDDVVITTSGLRGRVHDASYEDTIDIEIADGVVTTWLRAAVREKVNPPAEEPAAELESGPEILDEEKDDSASLKKDDSSNGTPRG